jgi:hypothetical protein
VGHDNIKVARGVVEQVLGYAERIEKDIALPCVGYCSRGPSKQSLVRCSALKSVESCGQFGGNDKPAAGPSESPDLFDILLGKLPNPRNNLIKNFFNLDFSPLTEMIYKLSSPIHNKLLFVRADSAVFTASSNTVFLIDI